MCNPCTPAEWDVPFFHTHIHFTTYSWRSFSSKRRISSVRRHTLSCCKADIIAALALLPLFNKHAESGIGAQRLSPVSSRMT